MAELEHYQQLITKECLKVICIQGGGRTSLTSNGSGWNEDVCFTLNGLDVHGVAYEIHSVGEPPERFESEDNL